MEQNLRSRSKQKKIRRRVIAAFGAAIILCVLFGWLSGGPGTGGGTVNIEITCGELTADPDALEKEALKGSLPEDGEILPPTDHHFREGETVYDCLQSVCRENKIHLESSESPVYGSRYVEGIAHLYEKDAGSRSGWTYEVNGKMPEYGCSEVKLTGGDRIRWVYVVDYTKKGKAVETGSGGEGEE